MQILGLSDVQINILLEVGHYVVLPLLYFGYKRIQKQIQNVIDDRANKIADEKASLVRQEILRKLSEFATWQNEHTKSDKDNFDRLDKHFDHLMKIINP